MDKGDINLTRIFLIFIINIIMERITLSILCELMKELPLEGYTADEITRAFKKGLNLTTQFEYPDEIFN